MLPLARSVEKSAAASPEGRSARNPERSTRRIARPSSERTATASGAGERIKEGPIFFAAPGEVEMPKVPVRDIKIHYQEEGSGFPFILIHGLNGDLTGWALVPAVGLELFAPIPRWT